MNNPQKKILIIEDDVDTLDILCILAEELNLEVIVSTEVSVVSEVVEFSPNIILLDHWVAGGLGSNLCFALKANELTKYIPIILISAHQEIEKIATDNGADGYIAKPFDINELQDKLAGFLK
jgi:DNA-binding response OmpR family regulator